MVRRFLVPLHRWLGLFTAVFLFVSGVTGAVISWDHELDAWLNPEFAEAGTEGPYRSPLALADALEAAEPRAQVTFLPLALEEGHTLSVFVTPRIDPATREPYALSYNQVALDPATGEVQARRFWGAVSLERQNILSFLYRLHYTLHLPLVGDFDTGLWFMGLVAIVWLVDGFVAIYVSFPSLAAWRRSFSFRWRAGGPRLLFDLHRSGGVWVWPVLVVLAFTAVSMNLGDSVVRPVVAVLSPLAASPFDRPMSPPDEPIEPLLTRAEVVALGAADGLARGFDAPVGGVFYAPRHGVYGVGFWARGNDHGDGTLGNRWLYYDGRSGAPVGAHLPGEGSAGDLFLQAQFPLHSGRWFGLAGRIGVSLLGVVVAALSATGVLLWARRQRRAVVRLPDPSVRPRPN